MNIRKGTGILCIVFVLSGVLMLSSNDGEQIGKISTVDNVSKEIIINVDNGKTIKMGEQFYVRVGDDIAVMEATFPMMTSAKCKLLKEYTKSGQKIENGMIVYRYDKTILTNKKNSASKKLRIVWLPKGYYAGFAGEISVFSNDRALVYSENEKYGFINKKGKIVIPARYPFGFDYGAMQDFHDGMAMVYTDEEYYYFIDINGKKIFSCEDKTYSLKFSNGRAWFRTNNQYGYVNKKGEIVIAAQFDEAGDFEKGYALVKKDGKSFYINTEGKVFTDTPQELIPDFSIKHADNKYFIADKAGKRVVDLNYDSVDDFYEGRAAVVKNKKMGYIDTSGKEIIPCIYEEFIEHSPRFSEGLAPVQLKTNAKGDDRDYKQGFIDKEGNIVVPVEYDHVGTFGDGAVLVYYKSKWGILYNPLNDL